MQTEKQRSSTIRDAVWGYTNRDAAEIDNQGRRGNLEVPSAVQRVCCSFEVFRFDILLAHFDSNTCFLGIFSFEAFPFPLKHFCWVDSEITDDDVGGLCPRG